MNRQSAATRKIKQFMEGVGNRRLLIQTHDIPDPDALASADALRLIARQYGVNARIVVNGLPHRRENKTMISECRIRLKRLDSLLGRDVSRVAWAFVDCLPGGGNVTLHPSAPGDLNLAIDHHGKPDPSLTGNPGSTIIHDSAVGATATILTRALLQLDIQFPPRLASALSYAIISDTQDFSRGGTEADLDVYAELFHRANQKIISRLRNATKDRVYYTIVHRALESAMTYRHLAYAFVGKVSSGESVAEMADFLLACERISWSLVLGHTENRLFLSLRSSQSKARCARVIHRLADPYHSTVGGHNEFAGGFVFLGSSDDPDTISREIMRMFVRRVLRLKKSQEDPEGTPLVGKDEF